MTDDLRARIRSAISEVTTILEDDAVDHLSRQRAVARRLYELGCAAPSWPKEWGGMDLPPDGQVIYHEEMAQARVRPHPDPSVWIAGPTILTHGTNEQRKRFLGSMLRAETLWCQGFSEPSAGSDLPSLRTTAKREGATFVVNGQKIWTSRAQRADFMYALVRTGTTEDREHGISYMIIDMHSRGVTVRPIRDMTGRERFCEVFLDDVVVPEENLIGSENGGWPIARTSLGHERSTAFVGMGIRYRRVLDDLRRLTDDQSLSTDPLTRQRLAALETELRLLLLNSGRALEAAVATGTLGAVSSVTRLMHSRFEQHLHEVAIDVHGALGLLGSRDAHAPERGRWLWGFLQTRASTIGAGTAEIQLNTVAERVLGLPKEPSGA